MMDDNTTEFGFYASFTVDELEGVLLESPKITVDVLTRVIRHLSENKDAYSYDEMANAMAALSDDEKRLWTHFVADMIVSPDNKPWYDYYSNGWIMTSVGLQKLFDFRALTDMISYMHQMNQYANDADHYPMMVMTTTKLINKLTITLVASENNVAGVIDKDLLFAEWADTSFEESIAE